MVTRTKSPYRKPCMRLNPTQPGLDIYRSPWTWQLWTLASVLSLSAWAAFALRTDDAPAPRPFAATSEKKAPIGEEVVQASPSAAVTVHRQPAPQALRAEILESADPRAEKLSAFVSAQYSAQGPVGLPPVPQARAMVAAFRENRSALERASALAPTQPLAADKTAARDQWLSAIHVGDVLGDQGHLGAALQSYQNALNTAEQLATSDPSNTQWQSDVAQSLTRIAWVQKHQGQLQNALQNCLRSLALVQRLAALDPANADWQQDLASRYRDVGDVLRLQGHFAQAQEMYQTAWDTMHNLVRIAPDYAEYQQKWAGLYELMGDVQRAQGQLAAALQSYGQSFTILQQLVQSHPGQAQWLSDWANAHYVLAGLYRQQGRMTQALQMGQAALAVHERLVALDPANAMWAGDLTIAHDLLGLIYTDQGRTNLAWQSPILGAP
jgi:tetratricopeptide (TPR) repeat protein